MDWNESRKDILSSSTSWFPCLRSFCPYPRLSVRKSLESLCVIVPSKSVKKMNLGFVLMAGRVLEPILNWGVCFWEKVSFTCNIGPLIRRILLIFRALSAFPRLYAGRPGEYILLVKLDRIQEMGQNTLFKRRGTKK